MLSEIELNSRAILQHAEAHLVVAPDCLRGGVHAERQGVMQQVVVGAVGAIGAKQDVGARGGRRGSS